MIADNIYGVDWGLSIRHDDKCNGSVTLHPRPSDNSTVQPGAGPAPATISARCDKCGWLKISSIAVYAYDADLANLADQLAKFAGEIESNKDADRFLKLTNRLRDRAAINTEYAHR